MNIKTYKTPKGTELPLLNLRGKQYLEVKFRLVWFREEHPDWSIETELVSVTETSAYARASIKDENGRVIATSHKFENVKGFPDFIEKAETGAIGRALALIGYGTQFCADELDEGKRIVDAPVATKANKVSATQAETSESEEVEASSNQEEGAEETDQESDAPETILQSNPGEYRVGFGRKYKGRKLKEISRKEMEGYLKWLETNSIKEGTPLSYQVRLLKQAFANLYPNQGSADAIAG